MFAKKCLLLSKFFYLRNLDYISDMLKHKTSVLFVGTEGKDKRTIQIPTLILLNWKKYLLIGTVAFSILAAVLVFFAYEFVNEHYSTIYKEKLARANQIRNAIDIDRAKKSFESIDSSFRKINNYLKDRGLKEMKLENAGGPLDIDVSEIDEIVALYERDLLVAENMIKHVPMGKPHDGAQTSGFGYRSNPFGSGGYENHQGLDFKGKVGSEVRSTAHGVVVFAGWKGGYGNCIIINHKNGFQTLYGHLSKIHVKNNESVKLGQRIGGLGNTGRSTGPHLHYEIIRNGQRINPIDYLTF